MGNHVANNMDVAIVFRDTAKPAGDVIWGL